MTVVLTALKQKALHAAAEKRQKKENRGYIA